MKRSHKLAAAAATALGLGLAAAAFAHPGAMERGMGPAMMHGGFAGPMAGQQLMTPEERHELAEATRAEMQKRAKEKGLTLPEPHGPRAGHAR